MAVADVDADSGELTMADTNIKRHPIRGAFYGLLLGISAAYFLFFQLTVFGFDTITGVLTRFGLTVLAGVVVGVVWAYVAPAKQPKGAAPAAPPAPSEANAEA